MSMERTTPPTMFSARNTGNIELSRDRRTISYRGLAQHESDVGMAIANAPVPTNRLVFYFEICIQQRGDRCRVTIGFSDGKAKVGRQPGTERNSYGFHSADGKLYWDEDKTREYGPGFSKGDVVGAGIDLEKGDIFFTRNGINLGPAFLRVRQALYPTVSVHSPGEVVRVNFGQEPFMFDLAALEASLRTAKRRAIEQAPTSAGVQPTDPQRLVRQLLLQCGYPETLAALAKDLGEDERGEGLYPAGAQPPSSSSSSSSSPFEALLLASLPHRGAIRQLLMEGRVEEAEARVREHYPEALLDPLGPAPFALALQKVVERVAQGGPQDPVQLVEAARAHLGPIMARLLTAAVEGPSDLPGPTQGGAVERDEDDGAASPSGRSLSVDTTLEDDSMMGPGEGAGGGAGPQANPPLPALHVPVGRASSMGAVELLGGPQIALGQGRTPGNGRAFVPQRLPPWGLNYEALAPRSRSAFFDDSRAASPSPSALRLGQGGAQGSVSGALALGPVWTETERRLAEIGEVMALACFADPTNSPQAHLLGRARRGHVADTVNGAILDCLASKVSAESAAKATATAARLPRTGTAPAAVSSPLRPATRSQPTEVLSSPFSLAPASQNPAAAPPVPSAPVHSPALDRILRQVAVVQAELWQLNNQQGEPFDLRAFLASGEAGGDATAASKMAGKKL